MPHLAHRRLPTTPPFTRCPSLSRNYIHEKVPGHLRLASFNATKSVSNPIPPFPPSQSIVDDNFQLHLALVDESCSNSDSSSVSSLSSTLSSSKSSLSSSSPKAKGGLRGHYQTKHNDKRKTKQDCANDRLPFLQSAHQRRSHFSSAANRQALQFGPKVQYCLRLCPLLCLAKREKIRM